MARPLKQGLSYFPVNCIMNRKIEILESKYNLEGFAIYIKLLQECYQNNKGIIKYIYDGFSCSKMYEKKWGIASEKIDEIIKFMVKIDLFDKRSFTRFGLLTSYGVKKRINVILSERANERARKSFPSGKLTENERKTGETKTKKEIYIKKQKQYAYISTSLQEELKKIYDSYDLLLFINKNFCVDWKEEDFLKFRNTTSIDRIKDFLPAIPLNSKNAIGYIKKAITENWWKKIKK